MTMASIGHTLVPTCCNLQESRLELAMCVWINFYEVHVGRYPLINGLESKYEGKYLDIDHM